MTKRVINRLKTLYYVLRIIADLTLLVGFGYYGLVMPVELIVPRIGNMIIFAGLCAINRFLLDIADTRITLMCCSERIEARKNGR